MNRNENMNPGEVEYRKELAGKYREWIMENQVKPEEYYAAGEAAKAQSFQEAMNGVNFKGEVIGYNANDKAPAAFSELPEELRNEIEAHGIASNLPVGLPRDQQKKFALFALLQIMATGEIKGSWANLNPSSDTPSRVFENSPFILLSNKGEPLGEVNSETGVAKLTNLRTVVVNGQYEPMIGYLHKAFPGVSFRSAEEINEKIFEQKSKAFKSFEDQIQKKIDEELGKVSL